MSTLTVVNGSESAVQAPQLNKGNTLATIIATPKGNTMLSKSIVVSNEVVIITALDLEEIHEIIFDRYERYGIAWRVTTGPKDSLPCLSGLDEEVEIDVIASRKWDEPVEDVVEEDSDIICETLTNTDWSLELNLATGRKCVPLKQEPAERPEYMKFPTASVGCLITHVKVVQSNDIPTFQEISLEGFWGRGGFSAKHVNRMAVPGQQEEYATTFGYSVNTMRGR